MTTSLPDISAGVTATLLALIRDLLAAPGMSGQVSPAPTLDSHLEQDLGLDSLGRTELFARVQREFGVHLPDRALLAETPRELLQAVLGVADGAALSLAVLPAAVAGLGAAETVGEPAGAGTLVEALAWHVQHHRQRVHIHLYGDADEP